MASSVIYWIFFLLFSKLNSSPPLVCQEPQLFLFLPLSFKTFKTFIIKKKLYFVTLFLIRKHSVTYNREDFGFGYGRRCSHIRSESISGSGSATLHQRRLWQAAHLTWIWGSRVQRGRWVAGWSGWWVRGAGQQIYPTYKQSFFYFFSCYLPIFNSERSAALLRWILKCKLT